MEEQVAGFKKDLSGDEKAKSYAKYFYKSPVLPAPDKLTALDKAMDPSKALPLKDINSLLEPGYHEVEDGWCVLSNGTGYAACHEIMPGITLDMINWWFAWHGLENLRYKIWWPQGHYAISLSGPDRAKVLDPKRSLTEKFQGLTHYVTEDAGAGEAERIAISFMTPEKMGFDMGRFKSPSVGTVIAANGISRPLNPSRGIEEAKGSCAVVLHFVREIPDGIEMRTRFWMGYHIMNKKPRLFIEDGDRIPDSVPKGIAIHHLHEFANLVSFLPELYKEQGGIVA
jgi:phloretin hydrolase